MNTTPSVAAVPTGTLLASNHVLTDAEFEAQKLDLAKVRTDAREEVRQALARGVSPFLAHRPKIFGFHSTALRLQAVVLNLYNDACWAKKAPIYLSSLIANADREHLEILIDLIRAYARNGENDPDFMALGKQLAEARQPKARRAGK